MLSLKNVGSVKNGFKDVFAAETPRRNSVDSTRNSKRYRERSVDVETPMRNSMSCADVCDDSFADFSRDLSPKDANSTSRKVLPKVGNKKSDKILGESLSDLSPAQSDSVRDPIEQFLAENVAEKKIIAVDQKEAAHSTNKDDDYVTASAIDESTAMKEKAALLMNILDRYSQEDNYENREPVVEEIIVPRKKKTGHICDEDDFHKHFHKHETKQNEMLREDKKDEDLEGMIITPKKPQRDLALYRKSQENLSQTEGAATAADAVAPVRRKKSLKRDEMPSPPPRPGKLSGIVLAKSNENILSMSPTKDLELEPPSLVLNLSSEKRKTNTPPSSPVVPSKVPHEQEAAATKESEKPLSSDKSADKLIEEKSTVKPHSLEDVTAKMKKRVLEFQMSQEYVMEDISNENDGSHQFTPIKLDPITKKVSVASMSSAAAPDSPSVAIEDPINAKITSQMSVESNCKSEQESLSASDTLSNDGSSASSKTIVQCVVQKKIEDKKNVSDLPAEESLFSQSSILMAEKNVEDILTSDINMQVLSNVLNDMYDKSVLEEFQNYLETEGTEVNDDRMPRELSDSLINDLKIRRADRNSVSNPTSPVIEVMDLPELPPTPKAKKPSKKKKKPKKEPEEEDQVSIESISDDGYTNLVKGASKAEITSNTLLAVSKERPRRESICDVDTWFNNHIDPSPSSLNPVTLRDMRMMRRGSDFMVGYDTGSTFPFGRSRNDSESAEFFEKPKLYKSFDNLKGSNTSLNKESSGSLDLGSNGSLNKDHSSLLRFVVQSPLAGNTPETKTIEDMKNMRNKQMTRGRAATPPQIQIIEADNVESESGAVAGERSK